MISTLQLSREVSSDGVAIKNGVNTWVLADEIPPEPLPHHNDLKASEHLLGNAGVMKKHAKKEYSRSVQRNPNSCKHKVEMSLKGLDKPPEFLEPYYGECLNGFPQLTQITRMKDKMVIAVNTSFSVNKETLSFVSIPAQKLFLGNIIIVIPP